MPSVNDVLRDEAISHAIDLQRYTNDVVRRMLAILNSFDPELVGQLAAALSAMDPSTVTVARLEGVLQTLKVVNQRAHQRVQEALHVEMRKLAEYEANYQFQLFEDTIPAPIVARMGGVVAVTYETVLAAAMAQPFQGKLLSEFAEKVGAAAMNRLQDTIRIGYVQGLTNDEIVRKVRGTRAAKYQDGILEINRRGAQAVVRTAVSHVANTVRDAVYEANRTYVKAVQWVSTLDLRTTPQCRIRDQLLYTATETHRPLGHKIPWLEGPGRLHWNCRSTSAPVMKSAKELGLDIPEAPPGSRASMDGQVPEETNYEGWLRRQSAKRQDEVLGKTRGQLFREQRLPMERFYNDKGEYLTLDELRRRLRT